MAVFTASEDLGFVEQGDGFQPMRLYGICLWESIGLVHPPCFSAYQFHPSLQLNSPICV